MTNNVRRQSDGAHRMAMRFVDAGYECTLAPFRP